jgi:hypothetical protein
VELTQAQAGMPDARTQIEMLASRSRWRAARLPCSAPRRPMRKMRSRPAVGAAHPARAHGLGADLLAAAPMWWPRAGAWKRPRKALNRQGRLLPRCDLTAFVGLNALGLDNLLQGSSRQMGITPALRLPIFDGKRLRAQLRGKQADLDTAIAQYNGAVLDAVKGGRRHCLRAIAAAPAAAANRVAGQGRAGL